MSLSNQKSFIAAIGSSYDSAHASPIVEPNHFTSNITTISTANNGTYHCFANFASNYA
jgi:hypothetical protein